MSREFIRRQEAVIESDGSTCIHPRHCVLDRPDAAWSGLSWAVLLGWSLAAALATPAQSEPLHTRNENPLLAPFGIPNVLPSRLPAAGNGVMSATFNWSNSMTIEDEGGRQFTMDGEGQELRLEVAHGLTDTFAVRAELPWRHLSGGSLDDLVGDWHELWGLPHGDRNEAPRDRLLIEYGEQESVLLHVDDGASGIGDIPVSLGYQLMATDERALAAWLTAKIPVGQAEDLSGSEAFDVALSVAGQAQLSGHWQIFGQADLTWLGNGDVLPSLQKDHAWSAMAGITWNAWRGLDLTAQLDANSEVFDAPATNVTGDAVVLNVGGSYRTSGGWRFDLSLGEDLTVDAAPDFTVVFSARRGY